MRHIYLLGVGSIGSQTLSVIRNYKESFKLTGISLGSDLIKNQEIIDEFKPAIIVTRKEEDLEKLNTYEAYTSFGIEGLLYLARIKKYPDEILVNALMGSVGLRPTYEAVLAKKDIALANKESIVMGGDLLQKAIKESSVNVYPVDSEHSAVWECLRGESTKDIKTLFITASGGSFRDIPYEDLDKQDLASALNHPNWKMGKKITIDSATLVNKCLEMIEAHYIFNVPISNIKPMLHKESIVHGFIEWKDNSLKAVFGKKDMRIPILYSLSHPKRLECGDNYRMDLKDMASLTFSEIDYNLPKYKIFKTCIKVCEFGGTAPAVFNAINEAAVELYLKGMIKFTDITKLCETTFEYNKYIKQDYDINFLLKLNTEVHDLVLGKYGDVYGSIN